MYKVLLFLFGFHHPPDSDHMGAVADDEIIQHLGEEGGEGPADGAAPVMPHQSKLLLTELLHQGLDVIDELHDVELVQAHGFLRLSVPPDVQGNHPVTRPGEVLKLMSPDKPELREAVTENHQWPPSPCLVCSPSSLDIVQLDPIHSSISVNSVWTVL